MKQRQTRQRQACRSRVKTRQTKRKKKQVCSFSGLPLCCSRAAAVGDLGIQSHSSSIIQAVHVVQPKNNLLPRLNQQRHGRSR
uniref:Uncharacterized protein n=1 Tax=Oryza glumipatula TaxID=40148 RepID=A0A0E0AB35_9ORYZ